MSEDQNKGGRPKIGTGGHHVTLRESNGTSNRLTIGKELWRAISSPRRVTITRRGNMLHITPTANDGPGTYAVSGAALSVPRISIGINVCSTELRIFAPARYDQCQVRPGEIVVLVGP